MNIQHKIIIGFSILSIFAYACVKEQTPAGLVLTETVSFTDTTYTVTQLPTPQARMIFVEEATGVHCTNCPAGAAELRNIKNAYPNRILSTAVYSPFLNGFQPPAKYDFNTQDALDLVTFLGSGDPSKPSAAINRISTAANQANTGNSYFYNKSDWNTTINAMLSQTTPLNIDLQVFPNGSNYRLKSTVTFTDTITAELGYSVFLIEDDVIDVQYSTGVEIEDYEHMHVLRKIITPLAGSVFLSSVATKSKGTVFERTFDIVIPSNVLNKNNCHLICIVNKVGPSKEVMQASEIHLP